MVFLSPVLNMLSRSVRVAGKLLIRDFNELENLQSSVIGTDNFVDNSLKKLKKNIEGSLIKIKPDYPCDHISEENDFDSHKNCWLISTIDGISNFKHAIPHFCISISLKENNEIISSIVYDPIKDEIFQAQKEKGCFLNDLRIKTSSRICSSVLYSSLNKSFNFPDNILNDFSKIKILGSPILDFCYLASGRSDLVYHSGFNNKYYEISKLILNESGAVILNIDPDNKSLFVSNKKTEQELTDLFKK